VRLVNGEIDIGETVMSPGICCSMRTGDNFVIESKVLPRFFKFALSHFLCSASLICTAWSQSPPVPHVVVGRVQIPAINHPLKLAEPNQISIQSGGQSVTSVRARWFYYVHNILSPSGEDDVVLPVSYGSNDVASVSVTPLKLGKLQLMLFVYFADGGFERNTIDVQVVQPEGQPERLIIASGGTYGTDRPVIYLDVSDEHRKKDVDPAAIYKNVTKPVPLNASDVTFKWINPTGAAEIDPSTGIVTARHVGQALLETSFGGVSTLTCIDVMENVGGGRRSRCEELLPPGRKLPPSLMELDSTPPPRVRAH
jgi:hypothetical protein